MPATTTSTQRDAEIDAATNYAAITDKAYTGVKFVRFDVATTTANAANDVIYLGTLPEGAIVLPELSKIVVTDDMSSGAVTIDIGDPDDVDRYCDGANCASVGVVDFLTSAIPDGFTNPYAVTGDNCLIQAKLITFAATVEAGGFSVILAYKTL
jgi:hypothetical protein